MEAHCLTTSMFSERYEVSEKLRKDSKKSKCWLDVLANSVNLDLLSELLKQDLDISVLIEERKVS